MAVRLSLADPMILGSGPLYPAPDARAIRYRVEGLPPDRSEHIEGNLVTGRWTIFRPRTATRFEAWEGSFETEHDALAALQAEF